MMGGSADPVDPKEVVLTMADGATRRFNVIMVDGYGAIELQLLNGERLEMDETQFYILAGD